MKLNRTETEKMKKYLIAALLVFAVFVAEGQSKKRGRVKRKYRNVEQVNERLPQVIFRGLVRDTEKKPIEGASVEIEGINRLVHTNEPVNPFNFNTGTFNWFFFGIAHQPPENYLGQPFVNLFHIPVFPFYPATFFRLTFSNKYSEHQQSCNQVFLHFFCFRTIQFHTISLQWNRENSIYFLAVKTGNFSQMENSSRLSVASSMLLQHLMANAGFRALLTLNIR